MLEFCERALRYADGFVLPALLADSMRYDAILRNLELIAHVGAEERALAPDVPWRLIVGTRNRVAHAYLGISPATVWDILTVELPSLRAALVALRSRLPEDDA